MFKIRQEDKSYSGVNLLSNLRIKSLVSDIKEVVDDYEKNGYGEDSARAACIKQLETSHDEIAEEAALTSSRPHGGKNMSLSKLGIEILARSLHSSHVVTLV